MQRAYALLSPGLPRARLVMIIGGPQTNEYFGGRLKENSRLRIIYLSNVLTHVIDEIVKHSLDSSCVVTRIAFRSLLTLHMSPFFVVRLRLRERQFSGLSQPPPLTEA